MEGWVDLIGLADIHTFLGATPGPRLAELPHGRATWRLRVLPRRAYYTSVHVSGGETVNNHQSAPAEACRETTDTSIIVQD